MLDGETFRTPTTLAIVFPTVLGGSFYDFNQGSEKCYRIQKKAGDNEREREDDLSDFVRPTKPNRKRFRGELENTYKLTVAEI